MGGRRARWHGGEERDPAQSLNRVPPPSRWSPQMLEAGTGRGLFGCSCAEWEVKQVWVTFASKVMGCCLQPFQLVTMLSLVMTPAWPTLAFIAPLYPYRAEIPAFQSQLANAFPLCIQTCGEETPQGGQKPREPWGNHGTLGSLGPPAWPGSPRWEEGGSQELGVQTGRCALLLPADLPSY